MLIVTAVCIKWEEERAEIAGSEGVFWATLWNRPLIASLCLDWSLSCYWHFKFLAKICLIQAYEQNTLQINNYPWVSFKASGPKYILCTINYISIYFHFQRYNWLRNLLWDFKTRHLGMFSICWKQEFAKRSIFLDSFEMKGSRIITGQIES